MAGQTSPLAFPYPTGTDRVMDGDNAMQALAEKVDDYLAPDNRQSATVTPNNGWSIGSNMRCRRVGDLVCLNVDIGKVSWSSGEPVITVPAGFRPSGHTAYGSFIISASGQWVPLYMNPSGQLVTVFATSGGSGIQGCMTYLAT